MSEEEVSTGSSEYSSEEEETEWSFEPVDATDGDGEGTRGLSDVLAMVGIGGDKDKPGKPLIDVDGNPIEAVYSEDGQLVAPRIVDADGNVLHDGPPPKEKEGMGTGTKLAIGGAVVGGAALAGVAALTAGAAATGVGVHYYRKKKNPDGKKKKKGKKGKGKDKKGKDKKGKDKKDKKGKDKKDKKGKDKKDKKGKDKKDKKDKKKKK